MTETDNAVYSAWDIPTRLFHWINVLCVFVLSILGLIMLNKSSLGISGVEAGVGLKALHVTVGYVFAINLIIRIIGGFFSSRHSRWNTLMPGRTFRQELKSYRASVASGQPQTFIGHNPMGRIAVVAMLLLLTVMMATGFIRAATDIYYPPFGKIAATYVANEETPPSAIRPYDPAGTDEERLAQLKAFRKPFGTIHIYGAYLLWFLVLVHVIAVVRGENRGDGTLVSAMFSGRKHLPRPPRDS